MSILQLILRITTKSQPPYWRFLVLMPWLAMGCKPHVNRNDAGTMLLADGGIPISRNQVVQASGQCALGLAKEFEARAKSLREAAVTFAATANDSNRDAVRKAWHDAADSWQMNLAFQFGPAASSDSPGGEDIAAQVDAWPLYNRCAVEEVLVSKSYETNIRALLVNRRGLHALEYLLFYEGNETACDANSSIVSQGTWAALSAEERASRRRGFAMAAAQDVADWSSQLVSRWDTSFMPALASSSAGNAVFASTPAALNAISDAAYYVDVPMMSRKLAPPLGLRDCANPPCLDLLESAHAARSKRNIEINAQGFRRLMFGCNADYSGIGFDDLLVGVGAEPLALKLLASSEELTASIHAVEENDLREALVADRASVQKIYDVARSISIALKTDFATVLDLELPKTLEGDND